MPSAPADFIDIQLVTNQNHGTFANWSASEALSVKVLLVLVAAFAVATTLMMSPHSTTSASADDGLCMGLEVGIPIGNDFTNLKDSGETFDFVAACDAHDDCYWEGSEPGADLLRRTFDRWACDWQLLLDMLDSCADRWPDDIVGRFFCDQFAWKYYQHMRITGFAFYPFFITPF